MKQSIDNQKGLGGDQTLCQVIEALLATIKKLRNQNAYLANQHIEGLRIKTIEEVFELSSAILSNDPNKLKEKLGNLLLHVLFYAQVAEEKNLFTQVDFLIELKNKLIQHYKHENQNINEEKLTKGNIALMGQDVKLAENNHASILAEISAALPSFYKAICLQYKTSAVGFDWWKEAEDAWAKVKEEIEELRQEVIHYDAVKDPQKLRIEDEFGDVLFTLIKYAKFLNIDPEKALEVANEKFTNRFQAIEMQLREEKKQFSDLKEEELKRYWLQAKKRVSESS